MAAAAERTVLATVANSDHRRVLEAFGGGDGWIALDWRSGIPVAAEGSEAAALDPHPPNRTSAQVAAHVYGNATKDSRVRKVLRKYTPIIDREFMRLVGRPPHSEPTVP